MEHGLKFSDNDLIKYLDGDLSAERAAAIEARIEEDRDLEARLLAFEVGQAAPLQAAFAGVPNKARLDDLAAELPQMPRTTQAAPQVAARGMRIWGVSGLAAAASFAVAAFLFVDQGQSDGLRWQEQVAIYQALYVTDTLAPIVPTDEVLVTQLTDSSRALGRDLPLGVVGELDGVPLLRTQVLAVEGTPLIQMAYLTDDGVPVALCVTQRTNGSNVSDGVVNETLSGLQSVQWSDGDFSYMIVGDLDTTRLARMADQIRQTL